jgi:tripartite-type tricarboxylate transporter receptor subunit TctC
MATAGSGSMLDMFGELFMTMAGVEMLRVPYRGAPPAVTDLLGGRVQVVFDTFAASIAMVRDGKLRPLAVTTAAASPALPGVPPMGQFLPGYDASNWEGIGAPANTPAEIVDKLNKAINAALGEAATKERLADLGRTPMTMSPAEFGAFVVGEKEKWGKVVRAANLKPE